MTIQSFVIILLFPIVPLSIGITGAYIILNIYCKFDNEFAEEYHKIFKKKSKINDVNTSVIDSKTRETQFSHFDTSKVTDISGMIRHCERLSIPDTLADAKVYADMSSFDASKANDIQTLSYSYFKAPNMTSHNKLKYDSYENWIKYNPILLKGEVAIESDNNITRIKVGDGITHYIDLPYIKLDINNLNDIEDLIDTKSYDNITSNILTANEVKYLMEGSTGVSGTWSHAEGYYRHNKEE